jgi:SAM-dependent methyltransferase
MAPEDRNTVAHRNAHGSSLELFETNWRAYRDVVDLDLMEHRALTVAIASLVKPLLPPGAAVADLGCGDLALLAPLLRSLPLGRFEAVDAAAAVLPLAAANLVAATRGPVPYPCRWTHQDLLAWAEAEPEGGRFDLITCCFALHHLGDDDKQRALAALRRRADGGAALLIADVFRRDGETRTAYVERYRARVEASWQALSAEHRQRVMDHLSANDEPAGRSDFVERARRAGWHSRWIWQGSHEAEALLLLWPTEAEDPTGGNHGDDGHG